MVEWKNEEAKNRLIAAIIASLGNQKLNYRDIALFFGKGATYDAVENQFRAYRKEAEKLKSEAKSSDTSSPTSTKRSRKERTTVSGSAPQNQKSKSAGRGSIPKKTPQPSGIVGGHGLNSTLGGRINKSKSKSPTELYGENALRSLKGDFGGPEEFTSFGGDGVADFMLPSEMGYTMFGDAEDSWPYLEHNEF